MTAIVTQLHPANTTLAAIRSHEQQARAMSVEFSNELERDLAAIAVRCFEASTLTALPPGVMDLYRRLSDHINAQAQTVQAISRRV